MSNTYVITRSGKKEGVNFDKVLNRVKSFCEDLSDEINYVEISQKTIESIRDGVRTTELDDHSARIAAAMVFAHPDYDTLASRIAVSNLHKSTSEQFSDVVTQAYEYTQNTEKRALLSKEFYDTVMKHKDKLNEVIDHSKDLQNLDYFGIYTLVNQGYLLRDEQGNPFERPQHMLMRVAVVIHGDDIDSVIDTYKLLSEKYYTHATPTLYNAGSNSPQMSSCFLLTVQDDSIDGIYETLKKCALISKTAGGIGVSIHNVRASGSYIKGTSGRSDGIIPMLRNFNETAKYVNQGGRRKGSIAIYIEPWHADIFDFLDLRKNRGHEDRRARELFCALWVSDLFMKRVDRDEDWTLFSPNDVEDLYNLYGEEFEKKYEEYERSGVAIKKVKARELWFKIIEAQVETGAYYMLYKDHANRKSNQKNLGTIRSSNLCSEIIEFTSKDEVAVCNLSSMSLPRFLKKENGNTVFDFEKLHEVTKKVTINLNKIIDKNFYPIKEAEYSNKRHRPIGIGVQGLADVFMKMRLPFDSIEARKLNKDIFETLYHGAMESSMELAKKEGTYKTFKGSPISEGKFQFDLWNEKPESGMWDWNKLREEVVKTGVRNSLLIAVMPTASTAHILGNFESTEPISSNIFSRRTLSGDFIVVNKYLMRDLIKLGIWNSEMKNEIIKNNGSIQSIEGIPGNIKELYRTVWEIPQKSIVDMAADRGPFICQSQSMNIHMAVPTPEKITSMHFHGWRRGLKTGMYYLRVKPAAQAIKFTVENNSKASIPVKNIQKEEPSKVTVPPQVNNDEDPNICISCGS